jgi:hypothetical protein
MLVRKGRDQRFFVPQNDGEREPARWHKRTTAETILPE